MNSNNNTKKIMHSSPSPDTKETSATPKTSSSTIDTTASTSVSTAEAKPLKQRKQLLTRGPESKLSVTTTTSASSRTSVQSSRTSIVSTRPSANDITASIDPLTSTPSANALTQSASAKSTTPSANNMNYATLDVGKPARNVPSSSSSSSSSEEDEDDKVKVSPSLPVTPNRLNTFFSSTTLDKEPKKFIVPSYSDSVIG